jgi:hypothetical protein
VSRALYEAIKQYGGTIADCARPAAGEPSADGPPQLAAAGPRAAGHEAEYELLLELILEGSLLHYGTPRVIHADDPDLALLLGDQLYALGLARLAALGDLESVDVLADVIAQIAQANAGGDPGRAEEIWEAGARAVGWGANGPAEAAPSRSTNGS